MKKPSRLKKEAGAIRRRRAVPPATWRNSRSATTDTDLATRQSGNDKIDELRYLMTYLQFAAGRLAEASVLGEAVARWGDAGQQATREAAMIALAATQEANETGWGEADEVGELDQMASIAGIISDGGPSNPQLDLIWMNLAQRYDVIRSILVGRKRLRTRAKIVSTVR